MNSNVCKNYLRAYTNPASTIWSAQARASTASSAPKLLVILMREYNLNTKPTDANVIKKEEVIMTLGAIDSESDIV